MRIDVNNDNKVSVSKVNEIDKNVTKSTGADKNEIFDAGVIRAVKHLEYLNRIFQLMILRQRQK